MAVPGHRCSECVAAVSEKSTARPGEARPPALPLQNPLLTKLNAMPAGRRQIFIKSCSNVANEGDQSGFGVEKQHAEG